MHWEPVRRDKRKKSSQCELSRARTSEGLDTIPEHGKNNSGYNTEIAKPESERRPVKDREGDMKSCSNGSVEDDDESDDQVSESYRRKSLSP